MLVLMLIGENSNIFWAHVSITGVFRRRLLLRSLNLSLKQVRYGSFSSAVLCLSQMYNGKVCIFYTVSTKHK